MLSETNTEIVESEKLLDQAYEKAKENDFHKFLGRFTREFVGFVFDKKELNEHAKALFPVTHIHSSKKNISFEYENSYLHSHFNFAVKILPFKDNQDGQAYIVKNVRVPEDSTKFNFQV